MDDISLLMRDSSENDGGGKEAMMDFILSWTLRRAKPEYNTEVPKHLYNYCREILGKLIGVPMTEDVEILDVETSKQQDKIDLWVNISLRYNGKEEFHAILIENKVYTPIHDGQLERYKDIFDAVCDEFMPDAKRHYFIVTAYDEPPEHLKQACTKENKFDVICLANLFCQPREDSGSDLFNEFWLRIW